MAEFKLPKVYDFKLVEEKWQKTWEEKGLYRFRREDRTRPTFSIDTPPPYPSGDLHVGNALNFSYIDFVARYKRMRGYNVFFPQGWDCHGLPSEVRVERAIGKRRSEVDPQEFLRLCKEYTLKWIGDMRAALKRLGLSIDWTTEYMTMNPDYWRRTQLSFVEMYKKGLIYRGEHPVIWCPRCETAIAEAEVEYVEKNRPLYYIKFKVAETGEDLVIATTRPELLASCVAVAVNPTDERYKGLQGKHAVVPVYERKVPIIFDEDVDKTFGTGAVMVCTYGDKTDVKWQKKHNLPVIISITDNGRMNENTGPLQGLPIEEARKKIAEILREKGLLVKTENIHSTVGTCWRCHTPVEILPKKQWFVKSSALNEKVLEEAKKINWVPPYMYKRLENWVLNLDWDWVISRQRLFATPIPVYYCKDCGAELVVPPEKLPHDPRFDPPPFEKCPKCGSKNIVPERDVMDTWMDSSITAAVHAGWPDNFDERLFPADLQPNGYDIIRTWDYYLLLRGIALFGKPQFKTALINGMVRGTDGRMMHKSYGNYVAVAEVLEKYGADSFRLWVAMAASTGQDVRFSWEGVDYAHRFLVKIWNAARLASSFIEEVPPPSMEELSHVDHWILRELSETIRQVTSSLENYQFQEASQRLVDFAWHKLCDHYLEIIKYRLSQGDRVAKYVLRLVLLRTIQMLSVFAPHVSEEIYQEVLKGSENWESVTTSPWPEPVEYDAEKAKTGEIVVAIIAEGRRAKHDAKIPLSKEISKLTIYTTTHLEELRKATGDIAGTLRAQKVEVTSNGRGDRAVPEYPEITISIQP
ncbi:MAG: valine--tRNA ligase [Thermofilum sp.]|jgi:valyl-tRNA synthetase|uniref:valine--tRNA ligase n=1 Tax=Thermofilum sp. TaxID=1961369 RepID=UPI002582CBE0|nr:valine--tRNA ligase [Thermofilum sp.]MCI4409247.1 valine--tRNA ligase [Thermofilum sp.]